MPLLKSKHFDFGLDWPFWKVKSADIGVVLKFWVNF